MNTKRIFMNEADSSPGNGAPAAAPAPAEPPAAPAAPASVTLDQVKGLMAEMLTGFKNATFAELRRAGALGKDKSDSSAQPAPAPAAAAPASSGLTEAQLEAKLETERVIGRVQTEHRLSDAQVKRLRGALKAEQPEDIGAWTQSYLTDMGIARSNETTPAPAPTPSASPISDKGSPAPGGSVAWEREAAENPIGMSAAAYAMMVAKHGESKARQLRLEMAREQAARIRVTRG